MKSWIAVFALLCAPAVADPAPVAAPPVSAPPVSAPPVSDWVPNESVEVAVKAEGPAFWHIKRGEAEIYILATIGEMPKGLSWNSAHAADVIKGARVVLMPPQASSGFFSTSWFLLTHRGLLSMPDGKKLFDTLPADLHMRVVKQVAALKQKPDEMNDDAPVLAALRLESYFTDANKLSRKEPAETVEMLARRAHVPVEKIAEYDALGLVKEVLRLPQDQQRACLSEAVGDVEARSVHARSAAEAWAKGDVKALKAHYTPQVFLQCARVTQSFNRLYDRAVADYLKAINEALSKPGKTVLVTDLGSLLRNTGVVEKLAAQGITIEGPAE